MKFIASNLSGSMFFARVVIEFLFFYFNTIFIFLHINKVSKKNTEHVAPIETI